MQNDTREHFNRYCQQQGRLNHVSDVSVKFNVEPRVQQRLESNIQESSDFLQSINIVGVRDMKGEKLGLGVGNTIASRTDTSGDAERKTQDPTGLDADGYECWQTNYDTHVRYAKLDAWAMFPDFQTRIRDAVNQRCALDRMTVGFHGKTAAANTDRTAHPLLEDVNIGWLELLRQRAPTRLASEGEAVPGKVTYGKGGDYELLDGLVYDAYKSLLDPWNQEDPKLVAIVSRDLMHDKLFPLVDHNDAPTERLAADIVMSQRRLGGLQAIAVPYFPEGTVLVTRLDNLSIYYQLSARRRAVIDNPRRDRVEWFESSNDAYVVEDYGLCALVENIVSMETVQKGAQP